MTAALQPAIYRPAPRITALGPEFYDPVVAAKFPSSILRFRNDKAAHSIGLSALTDAAWVEHFGRFCPLTDNLPCPLALRYHGHQFGVYNPDLGDGRGFLFAQMLSDDGRLMDLGTKGSGQTPWSRRGDGRLTLKGGVREILATEMLEALGVTTSRSFSLVETGEALVRGDEPSPTRSAVLVRLSHGHIRIGSFQRLAYLDDKAGLRALTDYVLREYFGDPGGADAPARLLTHVVTRTAAMAAQMMAAGFVHGVLNSDNINVTGECFDYGPWRFLPRWEPGFVAAYFDEAGRYAFGRQPEAIHWNAMQLAVALRQISNAQPLIEALDGFAACYQPAVVARLLWRLGVKPRSAAQDQTLIQTLERALRASAAPLDQFYFDAFGGNIPQSYGTAFDELRAALAPYAARKGRDHGYWRGPAPCSMLIGDVEAIWHEIAQRDDWSALHTKVAQIRMMGVALAD